MILFSHAILLTFLLLILVSLTTILPLKLPSSQELYSPFECGFDPNHHSRLPFSLQFFLIAVVFLIFDVEITLLLPLPLITSSISIKPFILTFSTVLFILMVGLLHEWKTGALDWNS